jgi:hypothetical protein
MLIWGLFLKSILVIKVLDIAADPTSTDKFQLIKSYMEHIRTGVK